MSSFILPVISGCKSNEYKDQLTIYHEVIGNRFIYYMNQDKKLDQAQKDQYNKIMLDTSELLYGK